jgi:hypothetical protein
MFLSEWREFPSTPRLAGKKNLDGISMLKLCASHDMLSFSLCNKKRLAIRHIERLLFPTTLLIPSYDMGK